MQRGIGLCAGFLGRFDRLFQAADFRFQIGKLGAALGASAGGAGAFILSGDQDLFGLTDFFFRLARRLAGRDGGVLGLGIDGEQRIADFLGGVQFLVEHRQAIAL